jgi:hypothetical protein
MFCLQPNGAILPYQDDMLAEHGYDAQRGNETWNPYVSGASMQSKPRSYNAPDGSVITEVSASYCQLTCGIQLHFSWMIFDIKYVVTIHEELSSGYNHILVLRMLTLDTTK